MQLTFFYLTKILAQSLEVIYYKSYIYKNKIKDKKYDFVKSQNI